MRDLTNQQRNILIYGRRSDFRNIGVSIDALERKGYLLNGRYTDKAINVVKEWAIKRKTYLETCDLNTTVFVDSDEQLLEYMKDPEVDIYVYAGLYPFVVKNGDGQNPLAVLSPMYLWEIEVGRTAGKFLQRTHITGHKGSYVYEMKEYIRHVE